MRSSSNDSNTCGSRYSLFMLLAVVDGVHKDKQKQMAIETINLWCYERHQHVHARVELFCAIFFLRFNLTTII